MTARIIQKEFVLQPAYPALSAVSLAGAWSSFMNTYAVWPYNDNNVSFSVQVLADKGFYSCVAAVDNTGTFTVNGTRCAMYNFDYPVNDSNTNQTTKVYHPGGLMNISITATNLGGPRGVAATIRWYDTSTQTIGYLLWNTRSSSQNIGLYQLVPIRFDATITVHAWGGGGGGGGMDAGTLGGLGSPGFYTTRTFTVTRGDSITVFIGSGGQGGGSSASVARGGAGGLSYITPAPFFDPLDSYNGGRGGNAGGGGTSGGGGGGGGASGVYVNNSVRVVAPGGGGGAGAGNDGNSAANYARRDASINNYRIFDLGIQDNRGENGQDKSGDGGGGGGGGGGYMGGNGGATPGGDSSAFSGQGGGRFPLNSPITAGTNTPYYQSGFSGGGARGGGTGQNGRVVLLIEPTSLLSVKVANAWKQVPNASVKVGGTWKTIDKIYVKVGNSWKAVNNSAPQDVLFSGTPTFYGTNNRPYSA